MTPATLGDSRNREIIRTSLAESLIVEASAGTGKTTELVNRIIAVLRTGLARIDQIVAVTFTNKAAGELKVRLRQELDVARRDAAGSELAHLEEAIEHLEEAAIGTIHAFCAQVLGERPVEARVDPAFQQMEEGEQGRIFERAFQRWFENALSQERSGLKRALSRLAWNSTRADDVPSEQLRYAGRALVEWRDFRKAWRREPFDRAREVHELGKQILALAKRARQCGRPKDPLAVGLRPVCDMERWIQRVRVQAKADYDVIEALMLKLLADLKRFKLTGRGLYSEGVTREQVVAERNSLIAQLENFKRRADADFAAELQRDMLDLIDVYEALKEQSGKLDFIDLLVKVRDLVRDNADVRRYLQKRFTHFFIDEFQDTDPVQAEILILLAADDPRESNWRQVTPEPGKLFIVGDPKQSIYRFRRADVTLYQEVRDRLTNSGVRVLSMGVSHRAPWPIQHCVNAAFQGEMAENFEQGQPGYVALEGERQPIEGQPAVVVIPAPRPWGQQRVTKAAIDRCMPDAIAAYVEWLVRESGWKVRAGPGSEELVPIQERHITVLFRRFVNFGQDITRPYVRSLEARGLRHLLVGSKSYHQREEVETLRAAFASVEWPGDELSVYATLRGSLFSIPDNLLLRYRLEIGHLHPLRPVADVPEEFAPITGALASIADLHRSRNDRPVAETLNLLLEAARAHAGFALRPGGHQVVGNVYRLADLARAYEAGGGISFRGFVEELNQRAGATDSGEAPLVEESADGVRLMTVHSAKGLEFPVVILADMTANIASRDPDRHLDAARGLCAIRLLRCAPHELAESDALERSRDTAEGVRIAYVAATRARDLLVVPGIGDFSNFEGWLSPLNKAIYPPRLEWNRPAPAPGCPPFGRRTVLNDDPRTESICIRPGLHTPEAGTHKVAWWDPSALRLGVEAQGGLSNYRILTGTSEASTAAYEQWLDARENARTRGLAASLEIVNPTDMPDPPADMSVELLQTGAARERPYGPRFGTLVHALLNTGAGGGDVEEAAPALARTLGLEDAEMDAAVRAAAAALEHPIVRRARAAARSYRELPVTLRLDGGQLLEGVIDLAFEESGWWWIVDYKTDAPEGALLAKYQRQVGWYGEALRRITGKSVRCYLLCV